ncbi:MAG: class I SAM-dependent methyltransferase [Minisyncoccia bacterium]|jgi:cyclopropane fatty-acyl-phospholipid synthase-like methyltransferase
MKNRNFFFQQYDKINWANQDKTNLNVAVYQHLIENIISKKDGPFKLFDVGSGIGLFIRLLKEKFGNSVRIDGCEPSKKSYDYFMKSDIDKTNVTIYPETFQNIKTNEKFDFITAIYVFPHFIEADLGKVAQKISSMLNEAGKLIIVVSNEEYLRNKLETKKDLFIEKNVIEFKGKEYKEYLHYVEIPDMGTVIDYDREEDYYKDLLEDNGLRFVKKDKINSDEYICTIFTFEKGELTK